VSDLEQLRGVEDARQICPFPVRLYHSESAKRLVLPCRRRVCPVCGPGYWRPRVLAGLHSGLGSDGAEYLAVLLTAPGDVTAEDFNPTVSRRWNHFVTLLRRAYPGYVLDYWRVAELQARGHVHFHFVLRGLSFLPVHVVRQLALRAGFGPWVGIRRPRDYPGGVRSIGAYFGKYLLKAYDRRSAGVAKLVTFSQGWRVGWEDRRRPSDGKWLYAGPVGAPWRFLGVDAVAPPFVAPGPLWRRWWRRSWQRVRAAEAPSVVLPLDGGDRGVYRRDGWA